MIEESKREKQFAHDMYIVYIYKWVCMCALKLKHCGDTRVTKAHGSKIEPEKRLPHNKEPTGWDKRRWYKNQEQQKEREKAKNAWWRMSAAIKNNKAPNKDPAKLWLSKCILNSSSQTQNGIHFVFRVWILLFLSLTHSAQLSSVRCWFFSSLFLTVSVHIYFILRLFFFISVFFIQLPFFQRHYLMVSFQTFFLVITGCAYKVCKSFLSKKKKNVCAQSYKQCIQLWHIHHVNCVSHWTFIFLLFALWFFSVGIIMFSII